MSMQMPSMATSMPTTMPMGTSDFCEGTGMVMQKGFRVSFTNGMCIIWLFEGAVLDTAGKYTGAVIGTFLLAFANEGIRWLRSRAMSGKAPFTRCHLSDMPAFARDVVLALMYGFQMLIAYWLMLIVMTYEVFLFTAILLGLTAGYLTFNYVDRRAKEAATDCNCAVSAAKTVGSNTPPQLASEGSQNNLTEALAPMPETATAAWKVSSSTPCCNGDCSC
ncbi:hypothetical protein JKP88DRAFT_263362 [Tribonema minus]|uniref:Copper transport protein n=1 Tax=Tribonema minus TaxID=303371 RepID=A0A835YUT5_9STRA|nr:hypothetical protein JKP88DRAFT_263362 [Tribonema minus]